MSSRLRKSPNVFDPFIVLLNRNRTHNTLVCSSGLCVVIALSITRVLNHIFIHKTELVEGATERAVTITRELGRRLTLQNEADMGEGEGKN